MATLGESELGPDTHGLGEHRTHPGGLAAPGHGYRTAVAAPHLHDGRVHGVGVGDGAVGGQGPRRLSVRTLPVSGVSDGRRACQLRLTSKTSTLLSQLPPPG